jgi:5-methylcytosine-specific restriction endonuclease McrA
MLIRAGIRRRPETRLGQFFAVKSKVCQNCKQKFTPDLPGAIACSELCAIAYAVSVNGKARKVAQVKERKETKAALEKFKTPSAHESECRTIVQKLARIRDRHDGCISCHMGAGYSGMWHGSHFRPAGNNAAVQFHLWNIHKACAQCNLFKGGNLSAYRPRLVGKIGADRVEWLESQNQPVKTNVAYLIRFKAVMGKRLRRIEKQIKAQA